MKPAIRRLNLDLENVEDFVQCRDGAMDMLIHLHRTANSRLDWTPSELASCLVDRGLP